MNYAVGMNPVGLLLWLRDEMTTLATSYRDLETGRSHERQTPRVFTGVMPTQTQAGSQWPFMYVYLQISEDGSEQSHATCSILVGTHSKDEDGWMDALNLAMAARAHILMNALSGQYHLLLDDQHKLKCETFEQLTPEARTYPFHYVHITATWRVAKILPALPEQNW